MIPLLIFYLHIVFGAALFSKRWQEEGLGEGVIALFFSGLIFFVGWSMTSFVVRFFAPADTNALLNQDNISLLLLTGIEIIFYSFYFRDDEGMRKKRNPAGPATGGQS